MRVKLTDLDLQRLDLLDSFLNNNGESLFALDNLAEEKDVIAAVEGYCGEKDETKLPDHLQSILNSIN